MVEWVKNAIAILEGRISSPENLSDFVVGSVKILKILVRRLRMQVQHGAIILRQDPTIIAGFHFQTAALELP